MMPQILETICRNLGICHVIMALVNRNKANLRDLIAATGLVVPHFVAIGEFKLELQSGNGQSGSNSTIFRAV